MVRTHFRTCNLCEAMCGVAISVDGERILQIRGDTSDPFSQGHVCPKAVALKDVHEDPDRLRLPQRRTASGRWETIGWDEAFDEVARRIHDIQRIHGRNAVALYQGNPTVHSHGAMLFGQVFARALRTRSRFSATSLDQLPHMLAALEMFGHQLLLPVPDVDRTDFFLVLGGNPVASNGSLMTAPGIERRMKAIRARGGRIVVVDPRRTETAELADRHLFIRPGTDALLLAALLHVLLRAHGPRLGRLAAFTDGLEALISAIDGFTPEAVAPLTGVDAATIRELAGDFHQAQSAVCYGRVGVSTQEFGGICQWLINAINIVTGNLDRPGGAMFTTPAIDVVSATARLGLRGHFARGKSRVRGLPEFGGEYPAAVLAEEIETPGAGQIRALVTAAGNPVLSAPNGRRLERALASLEFMVAIDIYRNETTRHAHLILPPTFALERDHYDLIFHALAVRNTAKYSEALFPRPPDARHDWEIFLELSTRLEARSLAGRLAAPWKRRALLALGPGPILDLGLRTGPYGALGRRGRGRPALSLAGLRAAPHGIDLGPLEPCLPERLENRERRIALVPKVYLDDLPRLRGKLASAGDVHRASAGPGPLLLIGRRDLRSNNSWMHNATRLVKGRDRCTLLMNPADARAHALTDGQRVMVTSPVGALEVSLEVSDAIMPGVVSLPHGWGHDREGVQLEVARRHAGVSINDLTDERQVDALSGNISFSGVPVRVAATLP